MPRPSLFDHTELAPLLRRPASGLLPTRLILVNYWLYHTQIFHFAQGRLFLTGHNGSGKSTGLTAAITLLLDGDSSPHRLDPFGGNRRSLRYYLLGDREAGFEFESRRAYLALEFVSPSGHYHTVGLGMQASEGSREVNKWGFYSPIRLEHPSGLSLLQDDIPLSKRQLTERLERRTETLSGDASHTGEGETAGTVVDSAQYADLVRSRLFGGAPEASYRDLLELMLTVRGSKLGREVKPSLLESLLRRSLPQVSGEVLGQLSEGIERIDRHLERVRTLAEQENAARAISEAHYIGALAQAQWRGRGVAEAQSALEAERARRESAQAERARHRTEQEAAGLREREVSAELETLRVEVESLEKQVYDGEGALKSLESDLEKARRELEHNRRRRRTETERTERLEAAKLEAVGQEDAAHTEWTTLEHNLSQLAWWTGPDSLKPRSKALDRAEGALRQFERDTERLRDREAERAESAARSESAKTELEDAGDALDRTLQETARSLRTKAARLELPESVLEALESRLEHEPDAGGALDALEEHLLPQLEAARDALAGGRASRRDVQARLEAVQAEYTALEALSDASPPLTADRIRATEVLEAQGIVSHSFFETVRPQAASEGQDLALLESGLLASGMLTALLVAPEKQEQALLELEKHGLAEVLLQTGKKAKRSLGQVLEPEDGAPPALKAALEGLSLDLGEPGVTLEGRWTGGTLSGTAAPATTVRYLGARARAQERQRLLGQLEDLKTRLEGEHQAAQTVELGLENALTALENGWRELREARLEGKVRAEAVRTRDRARDRFAARTEDFERVLAQLQEARVLSSAATARLESAFSELHIVELSRAGFDWAQVEYREAEGKARRRTALSEDLERLSLALADLAARQLETLEELSRLDLEREGLERVRDALSSRLAELRRELDAPDVAELRARLRRGQERLKALERELRELSRSLELASARLQALEERLPELERDLSARRSDLERANERLEVALSAHPGLREKQTLEALLTPELAPEGSLDALEKVAASANSSARQVFDLHASRLELPDSYGPHYSALGARFWLEGQTVLPSELLEHLSSLLEEAQKLLSDEESRTFHAELVSSLSEELDRRIREARRWVEGVRGTLRGLRFHEERLDLELYATRSEGLARLIDGKTDPIHQPDSWQNSVRLETMRLVESLRQNPPPELSFPQALESALDYRQWYGFAFYGISGGEGKRDGPERRREITDRTFAQRSGGERSAVLYTFLFAALGARFDALGPSVPRLVGIDEAFAGMDSANIAAIYGVMTSLELSWIGTSQNRVDLSTALPACATYQLFRAGSSAGDGVSSLSYLWNGSQALEGSKFGL